MLLLLMAVSQISLLFCFFLLERKILIYLVSLKKYLCICALQIFFVLYLGVIFIYLYSLGFIGNSESMVAYFPPIFFNYYFFKILPYFINYKFYHILLELR